MDWLLAPRIFPSILFLAFAAQGVTQDTISSIKIDSVVVAATRLDFEASGTHLYQNIPKINTVNQSVGDALTYSSPIYFKQYGPGMLQSASARGTGAGHLGVAWNGINIQSMTHGQVDFGLIGQSEDISYVPGGNSTMDGSGSLGGLVRLDTKLRQKTGWHGYMNGAWASFHNSEQSAQIRFTTKKWANLSEINHKKGKNDFPFINTASVGKPKVTQVNNAFQAINFRQSNQWVVNKNNVLNIHYWLTLSDRQIPPSMTSGNDLARQADQSHRLLADWLLQLNPRLSLRTKLAQIAEQLTFQNQALYSFTATSKQVLDSRINYHKNQHHIQLGIFQSIEKATSDGYDGLHQRLTTALALSEKYRFGDHLNVAAQSRLEAKDLKRVIPIYSISGNYHWQNYALKGKLGRHFHAPTFNDLFWQNLGDPDLKDEIGYQGEMSLSYSTHKKRLTWTAHLTGFWLNVNDWILWAPDNTGTWRPSNSQKVVSKGVELNTHYSIDYQQLILSYDMGYTYVSTVNKESKYKNPILGKQLIYIPKHKMNGVFNVKYKDRLAFNYSQLFVSKSPYKQDNSKYLAGYAIHNIQLAFTPTVHHVKMNVQFSITNLSNKNYQIIRLRPMPGRGYEAGVRLEF